MGSLHPLELNVLGAFAAASGGEAVTRFPTDKARALLVYLALAGEAPTRRDALAGLLWPEQTDAAARQNLRQALYRLRRLLNERQADLGDQLFVAAAKSIAINGDLCRVDAAVFQAHITVVEAHEHLTLAHCPVCIERLESAVALYRDEFLAGFFLTDALPFDEWLVTQREFFHHEALRALTALSDAYEQLGQTEKAYQHAQRQIALEPWREAAHRQLMRLLMAAGERSKALAQYALCARILRNELGVEPSAETTALYEQIAAGAPLAPLQKSAAPRLRHFPAPSGDLIGREEDVEQIAAVLNRPECRLLTLTGLGGIGKTTLATAVAQTLAAGTLFPDGLYFVALSGVTEADLLAPAIARALDLPMHDRRDQKAQVWDYLQERACLLVLDNFEQLAGAAPLLAELSAAAPRVKLLVTSRELLQLSAEYRYAVAGLACPPAGGDGQEVQNLRAYGAVRLFLQEARRVQPGFSLSPQNAAAVSDICRLVDGIPLAIAFAAGWLRLMDSSQIAAEIGRSLDFLATSLRDVPERQRSLRAVFEQSWRQLPPAEQRAFAQIGVFCGSFTLDAALESTQATHSDLAQLLDKSFLQRVGEQRYACHELLRQFAAEKLAAQPDMARQTARRHGRYYLGLMRRHEDIVFGPDATRLLAALQNDLGNIRQGWNTAVDDEEWALLEESLDGVAYFYVLTGHLRQIETMLSYLLANRPAAAHSSLDGYTRAHRANVLTRRGAYDAATADAEAALAAAGLLDDPALAGRVQMIQGRILIRQGAYAEALRTLVEARDYYAAGDNTLRLARVTRLIGTVYYRKSLLDEALTNFEESLALARRLGDKVFAAVVLDDLGVVYTDRGHFDEAIARFEQALQVDKELGNREGVARHTHNIGRIYRLQEKWEEAMTYFREALQIAEALGLRRGVSVCLINMGIIYARTGRFEEAIDHYRRSLAIDRALDLKEGLSNNTGNLGNVYLKMGRYDEAQQCYDQALAIAEEIGHLEGIARHLVNMANLQKDQEAWQAALPIYNRSIAVYRQTDDPYSLSAALIQKGETLLALEQYDPAAALTEEGLAMAEAVGRKDFTFYGRVQMAKLDYAAGRCEEARRQLVALLDGVDDAADEALLHDALWQMGAGESHRLAAVELYQTLYDRTPDITYKKRLAALSEPL